MKQLIDFGGFEVIDVSRRVLPRYRYIAKLLWEAGLRENNEELPFIFFLPNKSFSRIEMMIKSNDINDFSLYPFACYKKKIYCHSLLDNEYFPKREKIIINGVNDYIKNF